jgi:acyl-CoA thioesterase-1
MGKAALLALGLVGTAAAEEVTLAALGDSLTAGFGLPQEDGFVPQLEGWLQARGHDVRIINAGVSGDTTAGGLARVNWTLTPDVDGMIVALGGNDLLRGIPPWSSRENIEGILQAAQTAEVEVLLIGLRSPGNFGPEWQAEFDAIFPELSAQYGTLYAENFLAGLEAAVAENPLTLSDYMQNDDIHPTADGVRVIVEALGPQVEALVARVSAD